MKLTRIKLSATAIWKIAPEDEDMAKKLLKEQPKSAILDLIQDGSVGASNISHPIVEAKEIED